VFGYLSEGIEYRTVNMSCSNRLDEEELGHRLKSAGSSDLVYMFMTIPWVLSSLSNTYMQQATLLAPTHGGTLSPQAN